MTAAPEPSRRPLAVFDVDGVLADVTHRLHHLRARPRRAVLPGRRPRPAARRGCRAAPGRAVRPRRHLPDRSPERTRRRTERWLARHDLPTAPLIMRDDHDTRPARWMKREVLRRLSATRDVVSVLDDDPAVFAVLEADGWPVQLATWLPHSSTLQRAQEHDGRT